MLGLSFSLSLLGDLQQDLLVCHGHASIIEQVLVE
jgi:hypothetical protein